MYEWIRREVPAGFQPFDERSKEDFYASASQRIGDHWQISASYTHASNTALRLGSHAALRVRQSGHAERKQRGACSICDGARQPVQRCGQSVFRRHSLLVHQLGERVSSSAPTSQQGMGAHYCLGASGHGYQVCSRDQFNDTIGGATLKAVSTGLTLDF